MKPEDMEQIVDGICYAWPLSGERVIESMLPAALDPLIEDLDPSGRLLSAQARVAPSILYQLRELPASYR